MGEHVHVTRPHKGRNNISVSGRGHKGLANQERTFQQRQNDEAIKQRGLGNVLLDRWLATKVGSPETRVAIDRLKEARAA